MTAIIDVLTKHWRLNTFYRTNHTEKYCQRDNITDNLDSRFRFLFYQQMKKIVIKKQENQDNFIVATINSCFELFANLIKLQLP